MHHTSGIPDYQRLLEDIGFELTERTTQQHAVEALAGARDLDFSPGSDWTYSNSNYVLLAEVVRKVSGQPPGQYLKTKIFEPLNLDMVVEPNALVPGKAVSYQGGSGHYEVVDNQWEQIGTVRSRRPRPSWRAGGTTTARPKSAEPTGGLRSSPTP